MKDVEPLTEMNWTVPHSFIPNLQTQQRRDVAERKLQYVCSRGQREECGDGRQLKTLIKRLEEGREQGQPLSLLLLLQAQAVMAPSQPHNATGLCREESPPGTPIAVTRTERRAHIDTGASVSVIVMQPGKLLQCAIPFSRTARRWQQPGGAVLLPETGRGLDVVEGQDPQGPPGS